MRAATALLLLGASAAAVAAAASAKEPRVTTKVYFDVAVDGVPAGRIVMGLFGKVRLWVGEVGAGGGG